MCSPRKWSQKILLIAQVAVDNIFELMRMKITTFVLATSPSLFSETRWCPLEHEFRTQYSARLNSNGPSPLNGQIQMSAVWGKLVVKFPGEGTAEVFKGHTFAPPPPPPTSASLSKHWYLHIYRFLLPSKEVSSPCKYLFLRFSDSRKSMNLTDVAKFMNRCYEYELNIKMPWMVVLGFTC